MRKIYDVKFKGCSREFNKWIIGYPYKEDGKCFIIELNYNVFYEVDCDSVGQFVGVKDVNNNEVCENDIVKFKPYPNICSIGLVEYKKNGGKFVITNPRSGFVIDFDYFIVYNGKINEIKVIGNSYENMNLLNQNCNKW